MVERGEVRFSSRSEAVVFLPERRLRDGSGQPAYNRLGVCLGIGFIPASRVSVDLGVEGLQYKICFASGSRD